MQKIVKVSRIRQSKMHKKSRHLDSKSTGPCGKVIRPHKTQTCHRETCVLQKPHTFLSYEMFKTELCEGTTIDTHGNGSVFGKHVSRGLSDTSGFTASCVDVSDVKSEMPGGKRRD
jgi:hypothetical protein